MNAAAYVILFGAGILTGILCTVCWQDAADADRREKLKGGGR
jgi:hypothetical protein